MGQPLNFLISKIPKRYNLKTTKFLYGLIQALATGDDFIETEVEATRDNLIAVTATGRFLDRAAARYGIVRGQGSGLLDPDFQKVIPLMGASPKQVSDILLRIIDIFYGPYSSHANTTSSAAEPYALSDGLTLVVRVDDEEMTVVFNTSDFVAIGAATAAEVATAISLKTEGKLIGSVVSDSHTGLNYVNIRTHTIGAEGFIQVMGGSSQIELLFPEVRPLSGTVSTWSVSRYLGTDEMVYAVTSGPIPAFAAAGIVRQDSVTVRPDSGFNIVNTGTFRVTFVGTDFFRVENPNGVPEAGIVNAHSNDFQFFRPDLGNVLLSARPAALVQTTTRQLTIIIPVTAPVVKRTLKGGHHFHNGVTTVDSTTSNSITAGFLGSFDTPSGSVRKLTSRLPSSGIVSSVGATAITLINAQNWPTKGAIWGANVRQYFYYQGISGNTLQNVTPTPPSQLSGQRVHYTERYMYTSVTGTTLNGVFPNPTGLAGFDIAAAGAQIIPKFPGSFLYDPKAPFIAGKPFTTLNQTIEQGQVTTLLQVGDVTDFDASGSFVIEFGTDRQEGPIRYFSKIGTSALIVDPGHVYSLDHSVGVGIRFVRQVGPYTPRTDGTDLAVYTTSTSPARDLLAQYLRIIAASGVQLRFVIQVPDQKWSVLPNLYTTQPLDTSLVPPTV